MVFRDQLVTYRDNQLWFDAYNIPRCIQVEGDELHLSSIDSDCTIFELLSTSVSDFLIQDASTGNCMGLGGANCNSDRSTGGRECGSVDHRYLPLEMGNCNDALRLRFETEAQDCANNEDERPENACFGSSQKSFGNGRFCVKWFSQIAVTVTLVLNGLK